MSLVVKFRTIDDIKQFRIKIQGIKLQLPAFTNVTIRKLGNLFILDTIHNRMKSAGFSQKIIDGTILSRIQLISKRKVRLFFVSEYFAESGFDVALAREDGTKTHRVEPLSVGSPFFEKPVALHGGSKWPFFSKGHDVSGIVALQIVKRTVKELSAPLQDEYNRALRNWKIENLGGLEIAS